MFPTVKYSVAANRYVPFVDYVDVAGADFTGAVVAMEIRDRPNGGAVRAAITPTITVTTEEGVPVSRIAYTVSEADMEAMPTHPTDPSKDVTFYYDVHLTPDGGTKFIPFGGEFVVRAGVTQ